MIKTTPACRTDLEHYLNYPIVNHEFEVLDDDGLDYDFTGMQDIIFKLFEKKHGTLVFTLNESVNDEITLTEGNIIGLNISQALMSELRVKEYYHEMYWINADDKEILLFHGVSLTV